MKTTIKHPYFFFRELAVNTLTFLMNILYRTSIKDCACCYRLFTSDLWKNIDGRADQFEYDFSIICQAIKKLKENIKNRKYKIIVPFPILKII